MQNFTNERRIRLGKLKKGDQGLIANVGVEGSSQELIDRLMEMGLLEGSRIEVMHEAPFGKDPIAVKVRGVLIALRRQEADAVEVFIHE